MKFPDFLLGYACLWAFSVRARRFGVQKLIPSGVHQFLNAVPMMDFKDPKLDRKMQLLGLKWVDFEEKYVRGGGKGGQKINKSTNAVWLRHLPTGLDVKVQKFRELWGNRLSAYRLLVAKIEVLKLGKNSEEAKKVAKLRKQKKRRARRAVETKGQIENGL